ncbi:hypothetical protein Zm00014a_021597 [Zea mays]|nr:hypothetical protein Zm00014a_021597 [Zea mays]
MCCTIKL